MEFPNQCPECGADWSDGLNCTDHFHQMLFWEWEHRLQDVHHLMVLCYHLQHPSLYSPEGLDGAKEALVQFVERGVAPEAWRKQISEAVDSGNRTTKIAGTPDAHGEYAHPVAWTMTAADVVRAGAAQYYASVQAWAESILAALRESNNLV